MKTRRRVGAGIHHILVEPREILEEECAVVLQICGNRLKRRVRVIGKTQLRPPVDVLGKVSQAFIEPDLLEVLLDRTRDSLRRIDHVLELVRDSAAGSLANAGRGPRIARAPAGGHD